MLKTLCPSEKSLCSKKNEPNKKQPKTSTTETEWLNLGDGNYISKDNSFAIEHSGGGYKLVDTQSNATLQSFKTLKQAKSALSSRSFDPVDSVIEELRYNPYHDPSTGRFASSGGGGGGGVLVVEKGQKGKGFYVVDSSKFVASKATINVDPNAKMESSVNRLENSSVEYNQVNNLQTPLTQDKIIAKISGGDMTEGSCSSLALAYIGNEAGYDVLDFRGGSSQDYFSRLYNIREMANSAGGVVFTGKNAIKSTFDALNTNVVEGKTYYLAVGQHAAVVRKNGGKFEYLELQSPYSEINKFHELTPKTLHDRFSAKRSRTSHGYKLDQTGIIIESGKLATNSDFGKILGYINTPAGKQQKGALGNVK